MTGASEERLPLRVMEEVAFAGERLGTLDTQLCREWFHAFAQTGGVTLHVEHLAVAHVAHVRQQSFGFRRHGRGPLGDSVWASAAMDAMAAGQAVTIMKFGRVRIS